MTIKDFNLLKIDMFDGDNVIYSGMCNSGMCNEAPEELKEKQIEIIGIDGKKLLVRLKK